MTVQEMAQAFLELTAADEAELRAKAAAEINRAKPLPNDGRSHLHVTDRAARAAVPDVEDGWRRRP